ncbi:endonuclease [Psychromonas sp. MB-3u-54]|uniref:Z1 domain-containing protein n=1 Tax=Psychromonas sp. MB-3u-54 TaxID=2058319 RepID=UPI000C32107A|nr:Z1 domain-containing protein [Psychromonas sp. MB-3u-54]PKH03573.1 endonuclease [Psychromonas sp. MB-3u-54]
MTDQIKLDQIEDLSEKFLVATIGESNLEQVSTQAIIDAVRLMATSLSVTDQSEIDVIVSKLEERFDISMELGSSFEADDYVPWLEDNRGEIDWFFWDRYKRHLGNLNFPPRVITQLDLVTNKILDRLENPKKEGDWSRKGLVVGHVQSGKTANYTGVINKAADAGYKVIIVLAGTLSALRSQTQERIDEGFRGVDSSTQLDNIPLKERLVGVGKFSHKNVPVSFTTTVHDFKNNIAQQIGSGIGDFNQPVVLVIKKNKSILQNLISWLKNNNLNLDQFPFLLIDDEADNASINTNSEGSEATAINSKIRELLKLFRQNTYLGYTATPFANIFIDPGNHHEMIGDELFPRDFIISLDAPSNYVGSKRVFSSDSDLDMVRELKDHEDLFPSNHKKDYAPAAMPASLEEAIRSFILIRAIRILRNQEFKHNSMLINVSRFTEVQSNIKLLVHDYIDEMRKNVINHYALSELSALKNSYVSDLKNTFDKEFSAVEFDWMQVQPILKKAISPIKTIEVNASRDSEPLDYSKDNYPNGRTLIAVGGLSLSRGLTLEGLTVSYFIRNTQMYDTLMQMGRWFGYRDHFEDLCRLYMPSEAIAWYGHISDVTEELRGEFKRMENAKLTPEEFGLCVRSHPESLIVTARNKMRTGTDVLRQISLLGRQVETSVLASTSKVVKNNTQVLRTLINSLLINNEKSSIIGSNNIFKGVDQEYVINFLNSYTNHPASIMTESQPILDYVGKINCNWDIQLISNSSANNDEKAFREGNIVMKPLLRTVTQYKQTNNAITSSKRRFSDPKWEIAGIDKNLYPNTGKLSGKMCREIRENPLLTIYILDCKLVNTDDPLLCSSVVAWSISFPGIAGSKKPENLVRYVVNTTWWNQEFGNIFEEEEIDSE